MVALIILFWAMVLIILYTYIGFPVMLWVRAKLSPQPFQSDTNHKPSVSFIVCAYNEEDVILDKVNNLIALDYPADKLEIIVASDGSSDKTNEIVKANPHPQVRLLELPRGGKNQTLNSAVAEAQSDVLVFTDADTLLKPDALTYLVAPFVDETVGGVSGDFHYRKSSAEGTESERTYWSIDRMLKQLQTDGGSMTSASGQLYALRREYFTTVPDGVTDDFFVSVQSRAAKKRLVFEPRANCSGPPAASTASEFNRKVRMITRGLNSVLTMRRLMNPFKYGFYGVQLFTHKIMRRMLVFPVIILFIASGLLWPVNWFYRLVFLGQVGFHGLSLAGYLLKDTKLGNIKPLRLPLFFNMVYIAVLLATWNVIRGRSFSTWQTARSASDQLQSEQAS